MTTRQFNESVNADIRRMTNKANVDPFTDGQSYDAKKSVREAWHRAFEKRGEEYANDIFPDGKPILGFPPHTGNERPPPPNATSFSQWLEQNQDSIEPLDRTEATTKWFDEREANCE